MKNRLLKGFFSRKKCINNEKGLTLVEVILTIALLGIVTTMAYSLNLFSLRTFQMGSDQFNIQQDVRLASDYITREVRTATELHIWNPTAGEIPEADAISDEYHYIFINGNEIIHRFKGHEKVITSHIDSIKMSRLDDYELGITIVGIQNRQDYDVKTRVLLSNLMLTRTEIVDNADTSKPNIVLRYKKTN